jgi:hypothetical protein
MSTIKQSNWAKHTVCAASTIQLKSGLTNMFSHPHLHYKLITAIKWMTYLKLWERHCSEETNINRCIFLLDIVCQSLHQSTPSADIVVSNPVLHDMFSFSSVMIILLAVILVLLGLNKCNWNFGHLASMKSKLDICSWPRSGPSIGVSKHHHQHGKYNSNVIILLKFGLCYVWLCMWKINEKKKTTHLLRYSKILMQNNETG